MADREIKLIGSFKDDITPKLKKLNAEINATVNSFSKLQSKLRPIARDMGTVAMAAQRMGSAMNAQRSGIESNIRALNQYRTEIGRVARAQNSLKPARMPAPRGGGGGGGGGPRGGFRPAAAAAAGGKGVGFGALAAASFVGGGALMLATNALQRLAGAANGFVRAGSQFEQSNIQMAATIQTLGKVGDFGKSLKLAEGYNKQVEKIAAALPGSTQDYLTILKMTLDDQIQAYGSADAVTANLKKGERSFAALFGMSAQLAGLPPQIAAMDLNQLRINPRNYRQVQVLNRNPTLLKFYQEELKKTGGDFFKALDRAMARAITPEQVEALKNTFDSAYQQLVTTFTSPTGIFGAARKVSIMMADGTRGLMSTMDILGVFLRQLNGIVEVLIGTGIEPMQALNQFLYELGYYVYAFRRDLENLKRLGKLNPRELGQIIGQGITDLILKLFDGLLNMDFNSFLRGIDQFVQGLIEGIFKGLISGDWGSIGSGLVKTFGAFLTTWSGKIILGLLGLKFFPGLTMGLGRGARGIQGPMPTAGGTRGLMAGGALRGMGRGAPLMGRLGGGAAMGSMTAAFDIIDMMSTVGGIDQQLAGLKQQRAAAGNNMAALKAIAGQEAQLKKQKGEAVASGIGGAVGAVAGGALGAAVAGPIGAMIGAQLGSTIGTTIGPAIGNWWNSSAAPFLANLWNQVTAAFTAFGTNVMNGIRAVGTFFQQVGARIMAAFSALPGFLQTALSIIFNPWGVALNLLKTYAGNIYNFITTLPGRIAALLNPFARPPANPPKRAMGGPVAAGNMYMVGERGPEMFTPSTSGTIIPNGALGGTNVTVGTINVSGSNAKEIADQIAGELLAAMYSKSRSEVLTS